MATYLLVLNGEKNVADDEDFKGAVAIWEAGSDEDRENFPFRWSTGGTKRIVEGDNLILIRVGSPRVLGQAGRGIVAYGVASSDNFQDTHWDPEREAAGMPANYVSMAPWVLVEDPIVTIEKLEELFPEVKKWAPQSSGPSIPDEVAGRLIAILDEQVYGGGTIVDPPGPDGDDIGFPEDVLRTYRKVLTKFRKHQDKFRKNAFIAAERLYGEASCYMCGFEVRELLEAAHVMADSEGGAASVRNVILLCPTHHRALDRKFYTIDPNSWPNWEITVVDGHPEVASVILDPEDVPEDGPEE